MVASGERRFSVSRVTSCPEAFLTLIETFFAGTKALALALSDVDRLVGKGVDGGEVSEGRGWGTDGWGGRCMGGIAFGSVAVPGTCCGNKGGFLDDIGRPADGGPEPGG